MVWTKFWDMHSGGGCKEPPYEKIYIEAAERVAARVFYSRFGHNPNRVSCTCCGEDYSISEHETLEDATDYHRAGEFVPISKFNTAPRVSLEQYEAREDVLILRSSEISASDMTCHLPEQGFVWID